MSDERSVERNDAPPDADILASPRKVLIVEDDQGQAETLSALLTDEGFETTACETANAAVDAIAAQDYAVAVIDLRLPDQSGTQFVHKLRDLDPRIRIIVHTGFSTLDSAVESVNLGVFAYLRKGDAPETLINTVQRATYAYVAEALQDSQDKLRRIADNSPQLISYIDSRQRYRFANARYLEWYALPTKTLLNSEVREVAGEVLYEELRPYIEHALAGSEVVFKATLTYPDGETRAVNVRYVPDIGPDNAVRGLFATTADETEQRAAEQALLDSEARFRAVFEQSVFGICLIDTNGRLTSSNRALQKILGYSADELEGYAFESLVCPSDEDEAARQTHEMLTGAREHLQMECRLLRKDMETAWANAGISAVRDSTDQLLFRVAMVEDITVAKGLSEQLSYQATHDALTGLVNRREFETRLRRIVESMEEESEHALCYVDLDQFKLINDTCGHIAGDALLRQLGSMLPSTVRKRDTLARLGGDEFGLLMEHCPLEQAERVANSIRSTIANFRFFWEDKSFNIGASIGLVPISGIEVSVSEVMKAADAACYAAKEGGRNRVQVYRPDDETLRRRSTEMHWATRLTEAIENDHLELFYQPTVALSSSGDGGGDGVFIEVFLRLREADGRLTAPGAFLPSAERYGLASRLDRWVLEHALDWLSKNRGKAGNVEVVSINLSAQTVSDSSFCDALDSILSKYSVPPQSLCFEIAESIAVANLTQTQQFIRDLSAKGVRVALDDFGNGLSSFAYLKSLPVDYLKIDGALVREVLDDKVVHAMVRSISEIGQIMGKEMVAGFVESEAIMDELRMMGIDRAQGFAVQHPQPLPDTFTTDTLQII